VTSEGRPPQRNESVQPGVAQVQSQPDQHAEKGREDHREGRAADPDVGHDGPPEIAGQRIAPSTDVGGYAYHHLQTRQRTPPTRAAPSGIPRRGPAAL